MDEDQLREFTLLNNEFANAQRELAKANVEISAQREWLHTTLQSIADAVIATDQTGRVKFMNPMAQKLTQWTEQEAVGRPLPQIVRFVNDETRGPVEDPYEAVKASPGFAEIRTEGISLVRRDGSECPVEGSASAITGSSGPRQNLLGTVVVFRDVTERKRAEETIRSLALTDELTGLHNRRAFMTLAEQEMKVVRRFGKEVCVIFADLDGLKWINDNLGHRQGDEAIRAAAGLLRGAFRQSDIVARLGGDEFAVFAIGAQRHMIVTMTRRLQNLIDDWNRQPGRAFRLSISVGISHGDTLKQVTLDGLLRQADELMYANKKARRGVMPPPGTAGD